jgi:chemotaxis protein MotB
MDVGDYVIYLRAMDEAGNWGKASSSILSCREPHPLLPMVYVVYFDTAKVKIKEEGKRVLDEVARLAKKYPDLSIRVEGHTDSRPINTKEFPSNHELSIGRARAVATYLKETHGINGSISIFGYGPKRPIAPNSTQEGMAKNRRAEIIFIKEE